MLSHRSHRERQKPLQIKGLGLGRVRFPPTCRPIHFEELDDFAAHPDACAHDTCEAAEAQLPLREELEESQQEMDQEPRPDLPLDRVLVVPDEVVELARLRELLVDECDGVTPARTQSAKGMLMHQLITR